MKLLIINGSSRIGSFNQKLVTLIQEISTNHTIEFLDISKLPLFADNDSKPSEVVLDWRESITLSDGLIITSPEYLANIPAALKNALEWLNAQSNLANKKVLPIICTPVHPRGAKAMQALLSSLTSLHAYCLPSLSLYHDDFTSVNESLQAKPETVELLQACLENF